MTSLTDKIQVDLMVRVLAYHIQMGYPIGFQPEKFAEWEQSLLFDIFQSAADLAVAEFSRRMN